MKFSDVIGQQKAKDQLIQMIKSERIPHALLFSGPEGSGTLSLAIAFAQLINCKDSSNGEVCGICSSCLKFNKLIHPDLHFIFPVNTTKKFTKNPTCDDLLPSWRELFSEQTYFEINDWYDFIGLENKQGLIGKNESEAVLRKLSLKSFESDYKTMIIWMPELMNQTAANMLLKLIEEPPSNTFIILVSKNSEQILPTITSRTQLIRLSRIDNESLKDVLQKELNIDTNRADEIVHCAEGNYIACKKIIQASEEEAFFLELFIRIMRLTYGRKITEINKWVDDVSSLGRERIKQFITYCLRMIRENFILNVHHDKLTHFSKEEKDFSIKFHPFINGNNVIQITSELNDVFRDIERNGYARLILLDFSLKLMKLIKN